VIRFDRVSKRYSGNRDVVAQLSFEVGDAEMVFVTGRSGAGKSTVLALIALLERPTQGQIWVNGEHLNRLRASAIPRFRRQIGLIFQEPRLLMERTVLDNVVLPLLVADVASRERVARVRAALEQVGLPGAERALAGRLSSGERTRVELARAIVARPVLLLADEPTANLDAVSAAAVLELLQNLNRGGVTVVFATHDSELVRSSGRREIALDRTDTAGNDLATLPVIAAIR
jgi:cell division transport system ATP-binding protein